MVLLLKCTTSKSWSRTCKSTTSLLLSCKYIDWNKYYFKWYFFQNWYYWELLLPLLPKYHWYNITNSWHILSHQQHFIHVLIHYLTTTTGVISQLPSKLLHWCVCTQAWVRCVHSTSWYEMCTQLFNVTFWLTRIVHYSTVEETSCSIWNVYIIKFLQKCSIDGRIIIAIPVHAYVNHM